MRTPSNVSATEGLQARLATRLAAALTEQTSALPHDIAERLRVAREGAVLRAREARHAAPAAQAAPLVVGVASAGRGAAALLGGGSPAWWQRMASVLPLVVLVGGLVLINQWNAREQVMAAADIDAVLLSDDLPPAAYIDPGFAEFVKSPTP